MPPQMGNLRNLRTLSKFIVGSSGSMSRINELQNLNDLTMELSILQLQDVDDVQDATDASLGEKKKIKVLRMVWSSNFDDSRADQKEMGVLERIKPHANLERLTIEFYGGPSFPTWIADPSFSALTHLNLTNCRNCESVPSLGKLPKLQVLCITGMDKVTKVDAEFYREIDNPEKPFQSLESLTFENMPEWESWNHPVEIEGVFSCLRELMIRNCPKLSEKLPSQLPSLVQLDIVGCPKLKDSFHKVQSLGEINEEGNVVATQISAVDLSSLTTLKVQKVSELTCLHEEFVQFCSDLRVLEVHDCICLTSIWKQGCGLEKLQRLVIKECPQLVSLARNEEQGLPSNLEYLEITNCGIMEKLPNGLQCLTHLEELKINDCPKLVSFPEASFWPMLTDLTISNCELLNSLPSINSSMCSLECLKITDCPSLTCFPEGKFPSKLKEVDIQDCDKLQSLPKGMMHSNATTANHSCYLEVLKIWRCSSLTSFPGGVLPTTLKHLEIRNCQQLEVISEMLHISSSLECVEVCDCPNLKTLAGCLSPSLKNLHVGNCKNLKLFSGQMQNLSRLRSLCIQRCPGLESFLIGDLNTCLTILRIEDCVNLETPLSEWGLHQLTSLQQLSIAGIFPDSHSLDPLPETLTYISIQNFKNLESLESLSLQQRTSLQELRITDCTKLQSLLPSNEKLPSTLARFSLRNCPLLYRMYLKKKKDWAKSIAHVPCIQTYD